MNSGNKNLILALITLLILVAGVGAFKIINETAPKPQKVKPEQVARLVDAIDLQKESSRPSWSAGGSVMAAQSVDLVAQVSGEIELLAPEAVPGAVLKKGTLLAQLDKTNYQLALREAEAALAQAKAALAIEQGQVSLAQAEYDLSGVELSDSDKSLVLRKPQLQAAEADIAAARAAVDQAKANLKRTDIRMPFDGQVQSRNLSTGSYATASSVLFSVVSTSEYWIEAKVPRSFLDQLDAQYPVTLSHTAWHNKTRPADVLNVLPAVDSGDRQARVVLSLKNPLDSSLGPKVLVNDYLNVTLFGRTSSSSYVISRQYLNDNNTVWVVVDNKLALRDVEVEYAGRNKAWISSGLKAGDKLLVSKVDAAVPGLLVRIADSEGVAQ
jgi:membrane fusion protein (multidrug efflux system)